MRVLTKTNNAGWQSVSEQRKEAGIPQIPIDVWENYMMSKGYRFIGFDRNGHRSYYNDNPPDGWVNRQTGFPSKKVSVGAKNREKYLHPKQIGKFIRSYVREMSVKDMLLEMGIKS